MINEVMRADCFEGMARLPDNSVDCIITDPPYGTISCDWDTELDFEKFWLHVKRIRKNNCPIIVFGSEPFSSKLRLSNLDEYKNDWVWNKVGGANFMNLKKRPWKTHEDILVFSGATDFTFNPQRVLRSESSLKRFPIGKEKTTIEGENFSKHYGFHSKERECFTPKDGTKHPIDIIEFSKGAIGQNERKYNNCEHPTKKPLNLLHYIVKTYSNEGDLILDPFMGSFTTARACKDLKRDFIGFETDEGYCLIGEKRLEQEVLL